MQQRVRTMLDMLPEAMSRDECADFVCGQLYELLGFQAAASLTSTIALPPPPVVRDTNPIRAEWIGDKLYVQVPTRLHYIEHVIDIKEAIDEAIARVNLTDSRQLSPTAFTDLMARMRGKIRGS